jgi:hypothetical protein
MMDTALLRNDCGMIVAVAAPLERFYKPELDAAHNPRLQAYRAKTLPTSVKLGSNQFGLSATPLCRCLNTLAGCN